MRRDMPESPAPSLSIEDQVLLCGAHPRLSWERRDRLAYLLALPLDWSRLLEQADRHGMAPLLYHHLQGMPAVGIPEVVLAALASRARESLVRNLRLHHELIRLLGEFNRASLPVMPLKGSLLADLLYGDLSLRPMADIDLLVKPEDMEKAEQVLLGAGCTRLPASDQGAEYHVSYVTDGGGGAHILVELHLELGESHIARLDVGEVWASASRVTWDGREIWTMAPPDLLLYLCLHAVKDGLACLLPLLDIALAIERFGEILPWENLVGKVKAAHIRMPVSLSLLQSRRLLGAPLPPEFLSRIQPSRSISWLLGRALLRWRGGVLHVAPDLLVGPIMALLLFFWEDSLRGKLRHLRRNLFPSPSLRARWISTPSSSSVFRWYLAWLWQALSQFTRQLGARSKSGPSRPC